MNKKIILIVLALVIVAGAIFILRKAPSTIAPGDDSEITSSTDPTSIQNDLNGIDTGNVENELNAVDEELKKL